MGSIIDNRNRDGGDVEGLKMKAYDIENRRPELKKIFLGKY